MNASASLQDLVNRFDQLRATSRILRERLEPYESHDTMVVLRLIEEGISEANEILCVYAEAEFEGVENA